jgi:hypothetical protein
MRYLKTYRVFESAGPGLTKEQEEFLNKYTKGSWTYDPKTGLVDVVGDFDCRYDDWDRAGRQNFQRVASTQQLKTLSGVKFGKVSGYFDCERNQLTSLEGAPQEVGGDFDCSNNQLTSLEGAPQEVGRNFYCSYNQLTSLEGAPQEVGGDFNCWGNNLKSLEGSPQSVNGRFNCFSNKLTSLVGAPQKVEGDFDCEMNYRLTTLEGAPQEVGGGFSCSSFKLAEGKWNLEGWLKILKEGSSKAQKLILTLMSPEVLNKQIKQDPVGMIMKLKKVWNDESFKDIRDKLVWPQGYEKEAGLVGDLDDVGF